MDRTLYQNLIEILDKEILAYSRLKDLFEEKFEILKNAKPDDLGVLDNKILALNNKITKLNNSRKDIALKLTGKEDSNMSAFIALAEQDSPDFAEPLKERKVKICNIIPEIMLLNNKNVELLKHGITISNKMLDTIVNAFAPQGSFYNGAGQTDTHEIDMWTVNEEI